MKVVVLAFDGLEAEIVEKEKLENLLQDYHGVVDISEFRVATPMIWSSFLTGQPPYKHKMYFFTTTGNKSIEDIRRFLFERNVNYQTIRRIGKLAKPFLRIAGKKPRVPSKRDLNLPTIFDFVEKASPINVIMYNEWKESEKLKFKHSIVKAIGKPVMSEMIVKKWEKIFIRQKMTVLSRLNDEWDLLMTHIYLTDVAGHLYYNQYPKLVKVYKKMDEFTKEVKNSLENSAFIIVVSDHGMKRGMHTPHAFYSLNKRPAFFPKKITDFYKLIKKAIVL